MLNALLPGTVVPIHRHPMSNENVICLCGKLVEVLFEEDTLGEILPMGDDAQFVMNGKRLKEVERVILDPSTGSFGCVVPAGVWYFDKLSIDALWRCWSRRSSMKPRMGSMGRMGVSPFN